MVDNHMRHAIGAVLAHAEKNWADVKIVVESQLARRWKYVAVAAGCLVAGIVIGKVL